MTKKAAPLFGAAWVHALFESQPAASGLGAAAISKLTFTGGAPLAPSLAAALEHDRTRATIARKQVRAMKFADWAAEVLPDWAEPLKKAFGRTFTSPCVPLSSGSESGTFLYLGAADEAGEYPVVSIDVDDVPEWSISFGGYDAWLASDLGAARKGTDARIAGHAKRCFKGKKRAVMKPVRGDMLESDFIVFGRVKTNLDVQELLALPLTDAPPSAGFELFFPAGRDATLGDCRTRLGPKEFLELTVRDGEAILRGDVVDLENYATVVHGKLTAVRNWFWAVAQKSGAEFHYVLRENGRPINAWRVTVNAKRVEVERLMIPQFEAVLDREEYLSITKP